MSCIGATETVEGGDELPAGLCPLVVFCQSAWRRAGEMLKNRIHWEKLSVYFTVSLPRIIILGGEVC